MKARELLNALTRYKLGDKHVPIDEVYEAISELEALQQHIKSLEAQLANTEQLTCDGCDKLEFCAILRNLDHAGYALNRCIFKCTFFKPKDTQ